MNQQLKHKAFRLYLNQITTEVFEKDMYQLVEIYDLKEEKFLYDLVDINYRKTNYKKDLYNLLEQYCTDTELLILKIYKHCIAIVESEKDNEIIGICDKLASLYTEYDYSYDVLLNFYRLADGISIIESGINFILYKNVAIQTKFYATQVIERFKTLEVEDNWDTFLDSFELVLNDEIINKLNIEEKENEFKKQTVQNSQIKKSKTFFQRFLDLLR